jgi:hypothetical protein
MACNEPPKKGRNALNSPTIFRGLPIPKNRVRKPLLSRDEIYNNLYKNLTTTYGDRKVIPPEAPPASPSKENLKKEVRIPITEIDFSNLPSTSGAGKRLIMIDNVSYGPPLEQRQEGLGFTVQGEQLLDSFRITSGRYWTTTKEGENILFLSSLDQIQKKLGAPYKVVDYDYGEAQKTKLTDLGRGDGAENSRVEQDLDSLTRKLRGTKTETTSSQFATQQWVVVQASDSFVKASEPFNSGQKIRDKGRVKTRTSVNRNPNIPSWVFNNQLGFNYSIWNAYWYGGRPRAVNQGVSSRNAVPSEPETNTESNVPEFEPVIRQGEEFVDHSFELSIPFSHKDLENYNGSVKPLFAKFDGVYNFYIDAYEKGIADPNISESVLPNLYIMASEVEEEANNEDFMRHITLDDTIDRKLIPYKASGKKLTDYTYILEVKKNVGQYFDNFARSYKKLFQKASREVTRIRGSENTIGAGQQARRNEKARRLRRQKTAIELLQSSFKNLLFPIENLSMLRKYEEKRFLFPMYFDIEFSTDKTTTIAEILKDSKLSVALQARVANGVARDLAVNRDKYLEVTELLTYRRLKNGSASVPERQIDIKKEEYRSWDISRWLVEFDQKDGKSGEGISEEERQNVLTYDNIEDIGVFLGQETQDFRASLDPQMRFFRQLLKVIFVGKLRKLTKQKFRTFEELMSGKLAYSETVLYRIEKQSQQGTVLQNFYFPNSNEIDVLKFIDTQVKYNTPYIYKVYAYQAVIGTKYEYSDLMTVGDFASFLVTQYPSIRLVEVPYFQYEGRIIDNPPAAPEIEPIPYRGVSDKILLFLRSNVDDYVRKPIYIEPDDQKKYNEYRTAKDLDLDSPIRFKTDDHTGVFQIFRSDTKPTGYSDFTGKLIAAVETDVSKLTPQSATAASYVDKIEPNKKYYYTTRVVDIHGHTSYPGPVYEVEMVEERGNVYPLTSIVNFAEETPRKPFRTGKKYIMITPALPQMLIDENKTGIINSETAENIKRVFLGVEEESLWGKRFKIRLTSKQTGKKIDLNLDFTTKDVRVSRQNEQQ